LLGIAGQVVVEGGGDHELHAQASALLSAAFKRAQAAIEVALLPKLGP